MSVRERQEGELCFFQLSLELRYLLVQPYGIRDPVLVYGRYLVLDVLDHYPVLFKLHLIEITICVKQFVEISKL